MPQPAVKPPPPLPSSSSKSGTSWAAQEYDLDDDGWEDMPIIRAGDNPLGLDEEDEKKFHYVPPEKLPGGGHNATGALIDFDDSGHEWRAKIEQNENDYTRLRLNDDEEADEAYLRTKYLFDEDKAMTPLSQMQQTKNLLTEAQRVAYVGLCSLTIREMTQALRKVGTEKLKTPIHGMELWGLRIMGRLYYHMELETAEQKMIESLAEHGVCAADLVPPLMTTHTVKNPEYDPAEAAQKAHQEAVSKEEAETNPADEDDEEDDVATTQTILHTPNATRRELDNPLASPTPVPPTPQTTANVLSHNAPVTVPGVSTSLSATDENVTLDIRWTVLCDLFLILIADSVYDARSRVLLEQIAAKMGLGWLDVVKFEKRVTDALEIQEGAEKTEQKEAIDGRAAASKKRRYMMVGLATLGGGLVIGLSAGLLAPVIGAGLGAAFGTIGVTGTTAFLGSAGGAAVITTTGVLTGSGIAAKGMTRRTQTVQTFELLPVHNNKRVNCILTVPGFMSGRQDDVRLPFSVLDPIVGDVFSVLWEPEMMGDTGNALKILTAEVLSQVSTTVLQATVMTALMSAIQWPLILTKLGYLIDNPWSNALDRAVAAGGVLADVLMNRNLGVRPISLIGFSLGARVIFYALVELAKAKAYGIVQDVFLLGATVTAPTRTWHEVRGVVSGRFVNGYAKNDWILNYLFRATSGGLNTVAGLRPVDNVPGLENVDVTDKISGHMSYRIYMPVILEQLGFPVSATYFDEPEDLEAMWEKEYVREQEAKPKNRFSFWKKKSTNQQRVTPPPSAVPRTSSSSSTPRSSKGDDDLPERVERHKPATPSNASSSGSRPQSPAINQGEPAPDGTKFDFAAIGKALGKEDLDPNKIRMPIPSRADAPQLPKLPTSPLERSESAPIPVDVDRTPVPSPRVHRSSLAEDDTTPAPALVRSASATDDAYSPHIPTSAPSTSRSSSFSNSWTLPDIPSFSNGPSIPTLSFGGPDGSLSFPDPAPTLSFGSVDGTISSVSLNDPWSPTKGNGNGKKSWNSNPWT